MSAPALSRPDLLRERAPVAGAWIAGEGRLAVEDPATGAAVAHVPDLGARETEAAIEAAARALPDGRRRTARERGEVLRRWSALMALHAEDLSQILTAEQGKPLAEARGEIAYAAAFLDWFAEEGRRAYGEVIPPHQADRRLVVQMAPVGVVAGVTPWNFPAAMVTRKVAPALAAGCTFVLKPSELTPLTAFALAALGEEAGIPPGVFSVVTGAPAQIGEVLTGDPRVAKFTFTGSTAVGKRLAAACMATVKRVSLELGGNAPFLVMADADLDAAVEGAMASKFRNAGQTCVCANRFLVHTSVHDAFAERLAERADALAIGAGAAAGVQIGPLINDAARAKVERHAADALARGARALTAAREEINGRYTAPLVLADAPAESLFNDEETFGPLAGLVRCSDTDEMVRLANATRAGLAAYAYTRDSATAWRLGEALEYGMVGINTGLVSTEVAPFGGVKESGLGREGSRSGLTEYLDQRLLCWAV